MVVAGLLALVAYVLVLWDFRYAPFRTALGTADFSGFFDIQTRSLLDGNLAVPTGELGIEAFAVGGREYMYFPPGPALLRLPIFALTEHFDGRLTAPSMLVAWVLTTVLTGLLLWRVRRMLRGAAPLGRVETVGYATLLASVTSGSVVLYLGSMPFIYHEAYAWAIATSIGAAFCILGLLERPTVRGALGASAFTLGAVMFRTTAGWACAGALVLTALWCLLSPAVRHDPAHRRWAPWLALAGLVPLSVGIAINWAKFRHPYMFPLQDQVWTSVNEHRRLALEANGGDLVSTKIFPSTAVNYFRPDGIRFSALFPFVSLPAEPARSYGGSFLDQTYRTGSVPSFMPMLFLLSVWGLITSFRPRGAPGTNLMRIPLLGVMAIPGAIMFYGYIAYRYTSELVPLLLLASAVGFTDIVRRIDGRPRRRRWIVVAPMLALALFGFGANLAVSITTERVSNPGTPLSQYVRLQERISQRTPGDPFADRIEQSPTLPTEGHADDIMIVGDCAATFVATGESLSPWSMLEARTLEWTIDLRAPRLLPETVTLARADDLDAPGLVLDVLPDGRARARFEGDSRRRVGGWRGNVGRDELRLRLVTVPHLLLYALIDVDKPAHGLVDVKTALPLEDWFRQELVFHHPTPPDGDPPGGVIVTPVATPELSYCRRLQGLATGAGE
jgi:hypothetical protein